MAGNNGCAKDFVSAALDVNLYEAFLLTVRRRAINFMHGNGERLYRNLQSIGLAHIQTHVCDFRVGKRTPGNDQFAQALPAAEQRVLHHDMCSSPCSMGVLMFQAHVTGGIDVWIAAAQEVVDAYTVDDVVIDPRYFESELPDIWQMANTGEDGINRHRISVVIANEVDPLLAIFHAQGNHRGVQVNFDAIARKRIGKNLGGIAFFLAEE